MKTLQEGFALIFFQEGTNIKCRADYGISSDDLSVGRSLEIVMSESQKTIVKQFATGVALPQIKQKEGIS